MIILTSDPLIVQLDFSKEPQRVSVALTPIISKCLEQLVGTPQILPAPDPGSQTLDPRPWTPTLDPHQSSYLKNSSREETVSTALHSELC